MVGGATLTGLLGTSAWYAPGSAGAYVVDAIINDTKAIVPCSVLLEGEYGQEDICLGVPVVLGKKGIEKIVKVDLTKEEKAKFDAAADAVRKVNGALYEIGTLHNCLVGTAFCGGVEHKIPGWFSFRDWIICFSNAARMRLIYFSAISICPS